MLHKEFWGFLFLAFVAWIFIAGDGNKRIENFCAPVGWTGNLVVSLASLTVSDQASSTQKWFDKFEYGCRYMTWRVFYQKEYNKYLEAEAAKSKQSQTQSTTPNSSPVMAPPTAPSAPASGASK